MVTKTYAEDPLVYFDQHIILLQSIDNGFQDDDGIEHVPPFQQLQRSSDRFFLGSKRKARH